MAERRAHSAAQNRTSMVHYIRIKMKTRDLSTATLVFHEEAYSQLHVPDFSAILAQVNSY